MMREMEEDDSNFVHLGSFDQLLYIVHMEDLKPSTPTSQKLLHYHLNNHEWFKILMMKVTILIVYNGGFYFFPLKVLITMIERIHHNSNLYHLDHDLNYQNLNRIVQSSPLPWFESFRGYYRRTIRFQQSTSFLSFITHRLPSMMDLTLLYLISLMISLRFLVGDDS